MGPFNCVQGDSYTDPMGPLDTFCAIFLKYYNAVRKPSGFALRQGDRVTTPPVILSLSKNPSAILSF